MIKIEKCNDKGLEFISNAALEKKTVRFTFTAQVLAVDYEQYAGQGEYTDVYAWLRRNSGIELMIEDNEQGV